ncbi:solute carrier family 13 member 2-like isoform X2 [Littorina saxatilis]|uniref:solute carrier family 13 member 2-like isoform X2 n=1 Tax=Littorina saxatilis TaxID=31220 RepID=UPI0038B4FDB6
MVTKTIAKSYMSDLLLLFLGGLLVAVAIERWNLHRRIALKILLLVGSEPRWLMLGMMLATWFLSMWISNTATTAMMIPITEAVLQQLKGTLTTDNLSDEAEDVKGSVEKQKIGDSEKANGTSKPEPEEPGSPETPREKHYRLMCKGMSLSICYAANSGGIATLTGTGPNLVLKENADKLYAEHGLSSPVNFASWIGFGLPLSALVLFVCWIWLQIAFLRCRGLCQCCTSSEEKTAQGKRVKAIVRQEYEKLGPITFAEGAVLFWFIMLVVLWISRDLGGVGGWGDLFAEGSVSDATPAILIGVCLFFFPSRLPFRRRTHAPERYSVNGIPVEVDDDDDYRLKPLLLWSDAHSKVPWSLFLLLGGGFALSEGCKQSGLSAWMGEQLEVFSSVDKWGMLFILCYLTAAMTEVTSNTAISILLMPILTTLALRTGVHPLYYMFPAALSCSFAFMLPVATPPNAIVFSYGHVRVVDMMSAGLVMNILAVPLLVMATGTWGDAMFDFGNIPAAFLNSTSALASQA